MRSGRLRLRPHSIRTRYTLTVGFLALIVLTVIGVSLDLGARGRVQERAFGETQRVGIAWVSSMRPGRIPQPYPVDHVEFLQLVDSKGRVEAATRAAANRPPLSEVRPSVRDRVRYLTECPSEGRCLLVTAMRILPQAADVLWAGEPHFLYAATVQPWILAAHRLEFGILAAVLLVSAVAAWTTWLVVGRTLRPVTAIREQVREATRSDLRLRIPEPPGDDEIAQLARTSNQYLERLEEAVTYQRRFASLASHELRSPVAALRTQLDEALTYPEDVDPRETIRTAMRTTERFQAIIDELLAYTRLTNASTSRPEPLDLTALVRDEVAARSHGISVTLHGTGGPLLVEGVRLHLIGVVNNLLTNAQRHAHSRVEVTVERAGDRAVLAVQDDGDGIAPQDRERVFEPFVRLADGRRRDPGGSGLGLAICRETAKAHNGSLMIEDAPRGARFVLRVPVLSGAPDAGTGTAPAPAGGTTDRPRTHVPM
ncbi:sensor histidine kinase [Microbispora siamensis]